MSGELKERPGINQVWSGIEARRWDLILVEDASRLYRHDSWGVDLVYRAVDKHMRVICINDSVDTADDQRVWIPRLKDATRSHAQANQYTCAASDALSNSCGPRGALRSVACDRDTADRDHAGRSRSVSRRAVLRRDRREMDPIIVSAFEQTAIQDPPWKVAKYLTDKGVPKAGELNWRGVDGGKCKIADPRDAVPRPGRVRRDFLKKTTQHGQEKRSTV